MHNTVKVKLTNDGKDVSEKNDWRNTGGTIVNNSCMTFTKNLL